MAETESPVWHVCGQCQRRFETERGLRMHKIRKHEPGRGWNTAVNFRSKRPIRLEGLDPKERKREYQRRLRERYYREGKNSRGTPMPAGWKPRYRKEHKASSQRYLEQRERYYAKGLNAKGKPRKNRIEPIVYRGSTNETTETTEELRPLNYCPKCGHDIKQYK